LGTVDSVALTVAACAPAGSTAMASAANAAAPCARRRPPALEHCSLCLRQGSARSSPAAIRLSDAQILREAGRQL
jgi:hypothetical protein